MPRPALTDEQRKLTRRAIREVAVELYAESGFTDISARKVAERAGIRVGSLYKYFKNLTELMQSLWKMSVIRLVSELEGSEKLRNRHWTSWAVNWKYICERRTCR